MYFNENLLFLILLSLRKKHKLPQALEIIVVSGRYVYILLMSVYFEVFLRHFQDVIVNYSLLRNI